jgi:hypothetical protein
VSSPGFAQPGLEAGDRLASVRAQVTDTKTRAEELQQRTRRVLTETQAARQASAEARHRRRTSSAGQDLVQQSEYERLLARLETMPVIEQAKGIIMAQLHCSHAEAFDLLRRASQRSNVPVRDLAAQIVANTVQISPKPLAEGATIRKPLNGLRSALSVILMAVDRWAAGFLDALHRPR